MSGTNKNNEKETAFEQLVQSTHFDITEIEVLHRQFFALQPVPSQNGVDRIDRQKFRDLLSTRFGMTESLLMDRVFRVFDSDADNHLSFEEFTKGMSIFLRGELTEKMKFCFKVYDLNGDRYITKEEMFQILQHCLVRGAADEDEDGVKDIVDIVMKKLDEDRDGRVNEQDYNSAVVKDTILLEIFGQCLPSPKDILGYLEIKADNADDFPEEAPIDVDLIKHRSSSAGKKRITSAA